MALTHHWTFGKRLCLFRNGELVYAAGYFRAGWIIKTNDILYDLITVNNNRDRY